MSALEVQGTTGFNLMRAPGIKKGRISGSEQRERRGEEARAPLARWTGGLGYPIPGLETRGFGPMDIVTS